MKNLDLLKQYKIRPTQPRREIAHYLVSSKRRHFSAEDILKYLKIRKAPVSRASAYRAVRLFSRKGLLRQIDLGKGFNLYEVALRNSHHDHLYCLKCGRIIEFEDENIEQLQTKACRKKNFKAFTHTLRIIGLCKECR